MSTQWKVHFNLGIVEMHHKNFDKSKWHFDRALEIDPNYCEVDMQYGILAWEHHKNPNQAVQHFTKALKCKYTTAKSAESLHKIYQTLITVYPSNYFYVEQVQTPAFRLCKSPTDLFYYHLQSGQTFLTR